MTARFAGFSLIVAATAVAGVAGYVVTLAVYREVGAAPYAIFATFWATLYLMVGALSGIQQEVTRATHEIPFGSRITASRARAFALMAAALVGVVTLLIGALWRDVIFPGHGWSLVWPLAVGASSYAVVAVLGGSLYGLSRWRSLALMIAGDATLRLGLLLVLLAFTDDVIVLAWAVAIPIPLTIMVIWPIIRAGFVGRSQLDVGFRALSWNASRTVVASVSSALLVSGFPLLLGVTSEDVSDSLVGELIFTITLTRAPLIVVLMALQSYFVVRFRDHPESVRRSFGLVLAVVGAAAAIFAVPALLLGPALFQLLSSRPVMIDGGFIAMVVVSSALVGALSVSGSAVLARAQHFVYSTGWVVAAVATVVLMLLPLDIFIRLVLALVVGPICGLLVHSTWFLMSKRGGRR